MKLKILLLFGLLIALMPSAQAWYNNGTWETIELWDIQNPCVNCVVNITTSYNASDRWINTSTYADLPHYNYLNGSVNQVFINLTGNESQIGKAINNSNSYTSMSNENTTFPFASFSCDLGKFTLTGTVACEGNKLEIVGAGSWGSNGIVGTVAFKKPFELNWKGRVSQGTTNWAAGIQPLGSLTNINTMLGLLRDDAGGAGQGLWRRLNTSNSGDLGDWDVGITYSDQLIVNSSGIYTLSVNGTALDTGSFAADGWVFFGEVYNNGQYAQYDDIYVRPRPDTMPTTSYNSALNYTLNSTPTIISWGNNKTNNNSLSITFQKTENVSFNATANGTVTTWNWYKDDVLQSNNYNNITVNFTADGTHTIKVNATNIGTSNTVTWNIIVQTPGIPYLISPTNGSTQTITTLPYSQSFIWGSANSTQYNIQVAQDSGFSIIEANMNVANTQTSIGMWTTGTHYWRVRTYDGVSTYGTWSEPFNFALTGSSLPSGDNSTGIQGIVYEVKTTGNEVISGATILISNTTWTSSTTTDANGYYLFKNLSNNSLYTLQATKKEYNNGNIELVTTINGTWVIKNHYLIPIVSSATVFKTLPHNVKFMVQDWFGNPQIGVVVQVQGYNTTIGTFSFLSELLGLSAAQAPLLTQSMNGTTGQDGSIDFMLDATVYYNLNFTQGTAINLNWWLYPKEDYYLLTTPPTSASTNILCANINATLTHSSFNATHEALQLIYSDPSGSTTVINFYVQDVNRTYLNATNSTASSWSPSYNVNSSVVGTTYFWGYNATATSCADQMAQVQVITFTGSAGRLIDLGFENTDWYQWISIMLLVFTAALFSIKKVKLGAVVVPLSAGMYAGFGWFTINSVILASAIVIGILIYIRLSESKVVY